MADEDVFRDRQIRSKTQFLVYQADPECLSTGRIVRADCFAIETDLACVFRFGACENLHKGGFTGSVFTDKSMNLPTADAKIYSGEGLHTGKGFGYPSHL